MTDPRERRFSPEIRERAVRRRIVGWRVSRSAQASFVLDASQQALHERRPIKGGLVHHSDRGVQLRLMRAGLSRASDE